MIELIENNLGDIVSAISLALAGGVALLIYVGLGKLKEYLIALVNRTSTDLDNELLIDVVTKLQEKNVIKAKDAEDIINQVKKKDDV
jgi:hypothetical protein